MIYLNEARGSYSNSYFEDGFVLQGTHQVIAPNLIGETWSFSNYTWGSPSNDLGTTILKKIDGSNFDLLSIDLDDRGGMGDQHIAFFGYAPGIESVTQTFLLDSGHSGFKTFTFANHWKNLSHVSWQQLPPSHGFDNIVIADPVTNAIPEPTSLALMGLGLAGLGFMRRRIAT